MRENKKDVFRFSPSQLRNLLECPKCLWLKYRAGIERVGGIFPNVLGVVDRLIQKETSNYAGKGKPVWVLPGLEGMISQGSKRFKTQGDNWAMHGIVDDLIVDKNGLITIVDFKTATVYSQQKAEKYYQLQLDCYKLLLEANNLRVSDTAYLIFTIPQSFSGVSRTNNFNMNFKVAPVPLSVDVHRARDAIERALKICALKEAPPANLACEFCRYREGKE